MPKREVFDAALRVAALDASDFNGVDIFRAASGGFGAAKQKQLLNDLRTLYEHALPSDSKAQSPFGDSAA
jgi:hypothetical protein